MNILISGGCKNGKTALALKIAEKLNKSTNRYYVAAMIPYDDEDRARIKRHIAEREGRGFVTLEIGHNIASCIQDENGVYLIDSVTALLTNEMFLPDGTVDTAPEKGCADGLLTVVHKAHDVIFVTDDIFSDAGRYDEITEAYRRSLAALNRELAKECDTVIELCAGNMIIHKGGLDL